MILSVSIGLLIVLFVVITIAKFKKPKKQEPINALDEIDMIRKALRNYKSKYIDDTEITEDTATPLDNIAYFMTVVYPKLNDGQKTECNRLLFIFAETLMEMINQIFNESATVDNDAFESDEWYDEHSKHLANLYIGLLKAAYSDIITKHQDDFDALSSYKYNEMQKQIEVWLLDASYDMNEVIANKGESYK